MDNIEAFRQDVLRSYLKANQPSFMDFVRTLEDVDKRRKEIVEQARQQTTEWDSVLGIFNERFHVPFRLTAVNKLPVMLGQVEKPVLGFKYCEGDDEIDISKEELLRSLSMGERRALYLINVIFELRRRINDRVETLVLVDDIADSFDYNNKYAIIQYLQDVSKNSHIKLVIMTHNFDFFRTLNTRFVGYPNCFMATKTDAGIAISKATAVRGNMFAVDWKDKFFVHPRKKIASIPFLRNIIEMTHGETDPNFLKLTSALHRKADTDTLTVGDLDAVFNATCTPQGASRNPTDKIVDVIMKEANACLSDSGVLALENKIVLAIGIRLVAEAYAISKINDPAWLANIVSNQTRSIIDRFRKDFPHEKDAISILDRVELMTPENIHVNAFMYEPIIDMSDRELKKLFSDVGGLQ